MTQQIDSDFLNIHSVVRSIVLMTQIDDRIGKHYCQTDTWLLCIPLPLVLSKVSSVTKKKMIGLLGIIFQELAYVRRGNVDFLG